MKGKNKMKKVLSVILAAAAATAFSVSCFAVNPTTAVGAATAPAVSATAPAVSTTAAPTTTTTTARPLFVADDTTAEAAFKEFEKLIIAESESNSAEAKEIVFKLYSVINEANVNDYMTLSTQMKRIAEDNNSELAPVFGDMTSVQTILRYFTLGGVFDTAKTLWTIENGKEMESLVSLYTGAYIVKTTAAVPVSTLAGQTTMVENPKTGDSTVSTAAAFAVLGLSVAVIAVCAKKKES